MFTKYRRVLARGCCSAAFGLGISVLATPCLAAQVVNTEIPVSLADLDLRGAADQATLRHRIETAVNTACFKPQAGDLEDIRDYKACRKASLQAAMAEAEVRIATVSGVVLSAR